MKPQQAAEPTFASRAESFARLHEGQRTQDFVPNLRTQVETMATSCGPMPVTVHSGGAGEAWVCSPRTTYADCAAEESARYLPAWAAPTALRVLGAGGGLLRVAGVDKAVAINNWLLSTNLYPSAAQVDIAMVLSEAIARWPDAALWFRSLNVDDNNDWLQALQKAGARLVASRQVYLYDDFSRIALQHENLKRDLKNLDRTTLSYCSDADIVDTDYPRIAELYAMLYIGKYSRFNPMYGPNFLRQWHRAGLLEFHAFRDDQGILQSAVGLFRQGRLATAPIVGYNTALHQSLGLYRLATGCAYRACLQNNWRLNFSAGAAQFKRLRGGRPSIEYSAVFDRHLSPIRQAPLSLLSAVTSRIGVPLLRRYRL